MFTIMLISDRQPVAWLSFVSLLDVLHWFFFASCLSQTSVENRCLFSFCLFYVDSQSDTHCTYIHKFINTFIACVVQQRFLTQALPEIMSNALQSQHPFSCFPFWSLFFSLLHQLSPHPQSSHWVGSYAVRLLLVRSALQFPGLKQTQTNTHAHRAKYTHVHLQTCTAKHSERPFVLFFTALCTAATFC